VWGYSVEVERLQDAGVGVSRAIRSPKKSQIKYEQGSVL
jgi:hypothetical protein